MDATTDTIRETQKPRDQLKPSYGQYMQNTCAFECTMFETVGYRFVHRGCRSVTMDVGRDRWQKNGRNRETHMTGVYDRICVNIRSSVANMRYEVVVCLRSSIEVHDDAHNRYVLTRCDRMEPALHFVGRILFSLFLSAPQSIKHFLPPPHPWSAAEF